MIVREQPSYRFMPPSKPRTLDPARAAAAADLRQRLEVMLEAFERAEPKSQDLWAGVRGVLAKAQSLTALKAVAREFRGMTGALPPDAKRALDRTLRERFGPDPEAARDAAVVTTVRARGRIRSEREYRAVQAFADGMSRDPDDASSEEAYLELGALLDAFMAGA